MNSATTGDCADRRSIGHSPKHPLREQHKSHPLPGGFFLFLLVVSLWLINTQDLNPGTLPSDFENIFIYLS